MPHSSLKFSKPYKVTQGRAKFEPRAYRAYNNVTEDRVIQAESDTDDSLKTGGETFVRHTEMHDSTSGSVSRYWVDDRDHIPNLRLALRRGDEDQAKLIVLNRTKGGASVLEIPAGNLNTAKKLLSEALEEADLNLEETGYDHPDARVSRVLLLHENDELSHIQIVRSVPYPYLDYSSDQPIDRKDPKVQQHDFATLKYGFPGIEHPLFRNRTVVSYNPKQKTANWVAERVNRYTLSESNADRKRSRFKTEGEDIAPEHRATLNDYKGSGYDRGHLAPAANHKRSQEDQQETFMLANVSPQVGSGFNQRFWKKLEKDVRHWGSGDDEVHVVTGPAYLSEDGGQSDQVSYKVIGENQVAVPTHFFKVMLAERPTEDGGVEVRTQAFLVPNKKIRKNARKERFLVSIDDLEKKTGLDFFNRLPDELEDVLEAELPTKVWGDDDQGWHLLDAGTAAS
jgi:endonuclease G